MSIPAQNEARLRAQLMAVPDAYERMNYLVGRGGREISLPEGECREEFRVTGCLSQVWVRAGETGGRWEFRSASDAPMVRAVAALLCGVYSGGTSEEVADHQSTILGDTGVLACLTPSRRAGAQRILERIQTSVR